VKGITDGDLKARPVKTVAVLGGGLMGSGIATATLVAGMDVVLKEVNQKFLDVSFANCSAPPCLHAYITMQQHPVAELFYTRIRVSDALLCQV
jgi:NADPH-dependent 2,4-dienoyl-CoA reductase/sulfur reductase-like enzyme